MTTLISAAPCPLSKHFSAIEHTTFATSSGQNEKTPICSNTEDNLELLQDHWDMLVSGKSANETTKSTDLLKH